MGYYKNLALAMLETEEEAERLCRMTSKDLTTQTILSIPQSLQEVVQTNENDSMYEQLVMEHEYGSVMTVEAEVHLHEIINGHPPRL